MASLFDEVYWNDILSTCLLLSAPLTLVLPIGELGVHNNVVSLADSSVVKLAYIGLIYPSIARNCSNRISNQRVHDIPKAK